MNKSNLTHQGHILDNRQRNSGSMPRANERPLAFPVPELHNVCKLWRKTPMTPDQLREYAHREPFQPFRVRLHDGRSYDVRHPNLGLVGESVFIIGIPAPDDPNPVYADRRVWVPLAQIDGIEPLPEPSVPGVS